mgnify:FL=1
MKKEKFDLESEKKHFDFLMYKQKKAEKVRSLLLNLHSQLTDEKYFERYSDSGAWKAMADMFDVVNWRTLEAFAKQTKTLNKRTWNKIINSFKDLEGEKNETDT